MVDERRAAGICAEDVVAAVRVHLDRVHDVVRRLGCGPADAVEVVERSAVDLVDVVAAEPETVEDAVGWWFGRARTLASGVAGRRSDLLSGGDPPLGGDLPRGGDLPLGGGVLSVDDEQAVLAEALDQLPEPARVALLLRDSYDLPDISVAVGLATVPDIAMERVGRARLAFLTLVDDEPAPALAGHQDDLSALARLGEGGPVAARDATVRRHALSCRACQLVTDAQERSHLLLTGLTVVALPEADRVGVLSRVEQAAYAALPTTAALLLRGREELEQDLEDDERQLFSPLALLLCLVLAGLAGLGVGLLLSRDSGAQQLAAGEGGLPPGVQLASPAPLPRTTALPRTVTEQPPSTRVFSVPAPRPTPSPTPTPPAAPAPSSPPGAPAGAPTLGLDPDSGPDGTVVRVSGRGWQPDATITVEYLDTLGAPTGSTATVVADGRGRWTVRLTVKDPAKLPGPHSVRARDGVSTVQTAFQAEV